MTGRQLRALRRKVKLSQVAFAKLLGVAPNTVARQERDEVRIREPQALLAGHLVARLEELRARAADYERATADIQTGKVSFATAERRVREDDPIPPRPRRRR